MKEFAEKFKISITFEYYRKIKGKRSQKITPTYFAEKH